MAEQDEFVHRVSATRRRELSRSRTRARRSVAARTELFFDAQQLVVLGDAIGAAGRAGLDLAGAGADREVGDGRVLGLAGAVRDDAWRSRRRAPSRTASSVSVTVPI